MASLTSLVRPIALTIGGVACQALLVQRAPAGSSLVLYVFISPTAKNILLFFAAVVKKQQLKKLHITGRVGSFAPPFLTCVKCLPLPKVRRLRSLTVVGVV